MDWVSRGFFNNGKTEWVIGANFNIEDWLLGFGISPRNNIYSLSIFCFTFILYKSYLPQVLRKRQDD